MHKAKPPRIRCCANRRIAKRSGHRTRTDPLRCRCTSNSYPIVRNEVFRVRNFERLIIQEPQIPRCAPQCIASARPSNEQMLVGDLDWVHSKPSDKCLPRMRQASIVTIHKLKTVLGQRRIRIAILHQSSMAARVMNRKSHRRTRSNRSRPGQRNRGSK
jgi:hypothetical protein